MTDLTTRLAQLSDDQRKALIARLRSGRPASAGVGGRRRITVIERPQGTVPLSFTQERIWFLEQFAPGSPLHNMSGVARIPVPMDDGMFAECLAEVVARHESLRTRFALRDGEPTAIVEESVTVPLRVLPDLQEPERERCFREEARLPFDVEAGPLLRACLAPADAACYVQLTMHHLVSDGFSNGVFFRELGALIGARLTNTRAQLPGVPFQFADYAAWEREVYSGEALGGPVDYWADHLRGAPRQLALPGDRSRPARMTYRGGRLPLDLPDELADRIRAVSRERGVTPFVTVLAAFATVIGRFSGQNDLIVGVPVANRDEVGTERLIGPFLNTVALRIRLDEDLTGAELLSQVSQTMLQGYDHQGAPFEKVLSAVQTARDPSRSPLFQVLVNFQADQSAAAGAPGGVELRDIPNGCCQFDLLLNVVTTPKGMRGHIDYYADVYDESSVARLADSWLCVLWALAGELERPIAGLPLVPEDERVRLVELAAKSTATDFAGDNRIPKVVLAAGRHDPARSAVVGEQGTLTFGELDARSAALARQLRARVGRLPVGATPHIAICLPRSPDMIVAILGVLRAGFAYVPLDPDYPRDRLAFICGDAGIAALVTRSDVRDALPVVTVPAIELDRPLAQSPQDASAEETIDAADGQPCAYTIYTSGSTGVPKGVSVSHRNVVNFLESMRVRPGMTEDDVLLAVTSPSFDIAVLEMLLPLVVGGRVVVASPQDAMDGRRLAGLMDEHGVTIMQATPATWQLLVDSGWTGRAGLLVLCGGEAFPPSLADALLRRCAQVWNMYGPTETTIWSTVHRVTAADAEAGVIPIGTPIANTTAFVLDQGLNPVPATVPGELCLGGEGVTLGYHGRPDLTEQRYVQAPFWPGHRLYRTGDVVRACPDGILEYLGRSDSQVKLRGYRIELGEIEAILESHPGVARAVAVIHGQASDGPDEKAIVAYVQPSVPSPTAIGEGTSGSAGTLEVAGLKKFLRERLPGYMMPARFVAVTEYRLTPNGKIDRKSLPVPAVSASEGLVPEGASASAGSGPRRDYVAPRTETEKVLAATWAGLLNLPDVGIYDSFFEIGGHSLLATKLVFQVREAFGVDLPLLAFFEGEPTIERLAGIVAGLASGKGLPDSGRDLDLEAEALLPDDIRPEPGVHVHAVRHPSHLLLTGATGFVGAFLLAELLATTEAMVFCLVRVPSSREGLSRIQEAMSAYGIWDPSYAARIIPVNGSLSQGRLGVSRPQWDHLAAMVDVIYHCGADVNFVKPYQTLRAANVTGTADVLRLACDGSVKPVHFISTTYVFDRFSYPAGIVFTEDMRPVHSLKNTFGYTQSKWVSEQIVLEAGRRGLPVWVYRVGRTAGHSETGVCQMYDFIWQAMKVGIDMGAAPVIDMTLDITPVDYVAASIVHLSRQPALSGQVFHVVSKTPLREQELVSWLEGYGYSGERVSFAEWRRRVIERAAQLDDDAAGALAPFLSGALPLERIPAAHFDDTNVTRGLAGSAITCPPVDDRLLRTYIDYFTEIGYLPSPRGQEARVPGKAGVPGKEGEQ